MPNRIVVVALLALVAMAGGYAIYRFGVQQGEHTSSVPKSGAGPADSSEFAAIRAAERIEDPLQRCQAYPNPPELKWDAKIVAALCKRSNWGMIGWRQIQDALEQHHPETLDKVFDEYLARNYSDHESHGYLTWTFFWMFQGTSKWIDDTTRQWVEEAPQSAYALAARGIYFSEAAYKARGTEYANKTPDDNFRQMDEYVAKSREALTQSLRRNPRLIAAYHGLLHTSRLSHDGDQRQEWINKALLLDPADPWIYDDWMDAVEPKWGGSDALMNDVVEAASQHVAENPLLATVRARPLCYAAEERRCSDCQPNGAMALDLYQQAGGFGPAACFLEGAGAAAVLAQDSRTAVRYYSQALRFLKRPEWLAYRAPPLRSLGENEWALQDLHDALAAEPRNTTALYSQGLAYADLGRLGDAEKSYLAVLAIDPDDRNAALAVSIQYLTDNSPLHAPDKARPLIAHLIEHEPTLAQAWLLRAAIAWTDKDAPVYIDAAQRYLKFVNHDDAANKSDIEAIKTRISQVRDYARANGIHVDEN